jgi:hypothetical protein
VLDVEELGTDFALSTHLTPSASCTIVLGPDLRIKRSLYGWIAAKTSSGVALIQHSEIHFAPTHPVELSVYDVRDDSLTQIYPAEGAALRAKYVAALRANLSLDWCRENNSHCDPELLDADLMETVAGENPSSFAFKLRFNPTGFGPSTEGVDSEEVVYVFMRRGEKWVFREFAADEFPMPLEEAVTADGLKKVFAEMQP